MVLAIVEAGELAMAREYADVFGLVSVLGCDLSDDALAAAAARCVKKELNPINNVTGSRCWCLPNERNMPSQHA